MNRTQVFALAVVAFATALARGQPLTNAGNWQATGTHGAVAAGGKEAADAGLTILKAGGNAADAAVATILALSVTDYTLFCFGGDLPMLVYDANRGVVEVLCGLGVAPRLATQEHFAKLSAIPGRGVEPAAVPGVLDACVTALSRYGTKTFAEVAGPTLTLLDQHKLDWHVDLATTLRRLIVAEKASPTDRLRGLRLVSDYFYRGPIAREIDEWCRANGGLLRYTDMATHTTRIEDAATIDYRGHTVCKCGVWTQGPCLLQSLQLLEGFDLKALGAGSPEAVHLSTEALKLALADRDAWYADPLFIDVPAKELLAPTYAAMRRGLIDPQHASLMRRPGDPRAGKALQDKPNVREGPGQDPGDTTTCVVADAQGNVVAATPSGFYGVIAGKTGVKLGTRLQSFNNWAGHDNCIEPGKRPRITLTPTIVLKNGKPVYAVSVAGGDAQDQTTLQLLIDAIDFGMDPAKAVVTPRFVTEHHLGSFRQAPAKLGHLQVNAEIGDETIKALEARGHKVVIKKSAIAAPVMLWIDPATGTIYAAGDPRAKRHAAAW